jgi:hypothetical protein
MTRIKYKIQKKPFSVIENWQAVHGQAVIGRPLAKQSLPGIHA